MEAQTDTRRTDALAELLFDANVYGRELAAVRRVEIEWLEGAKSWGAAVTTAGRLARFYEAIAKGDRAGADKVLRLWGIRR